MEDIEVPRDQIAYQKHRREVFWQITLPVLVGIGIFLVAFVLVILSGSRGASQGADIAAIWLLILPIFMTLIGCVLVAALVYGVWKLIEVLPSNMYKLQNALMMVRNKVSNFSNYSTAPFIKAQSISASMSAFWRSLFKKGTR